MLAELEQRLYHLSLDGRVGRSSQPFPMSALTGRLSSSDATFVCLGELLYFSLFMKGFARMVLIDDRVLRTGDREDGDVASGWGEHWRFFSPMA